MHKEQKLLLDISGPSAALFTNPVPGALWSLGRLSHHVTSQIFTLLKGLRRQVYIMKVSHLLYFLKQVFAVPVAQRGLSFSQRLFCDLHCGLLCPNTTDTGARTVTSRLRMFPTSHPASKLGAVWLLSAWRPLWAAP